MSSLFVSILRQALKTFDQTNQNFNVNFSLLKELINQLTYKDIYLSKKKFLSDVFFDKPGQAPCTFVCIFENKTISMSVFILRGGYTMPLHDHPCMHGLLRCIHGQLQVQSYTKKLCDNEPITYNPNQREVQVVAEEPRIISPHEECAILTPHERNFHEIKALDGVAAFFDILSPPYDADIPEHGLRKCHYFRPLRKQISSRIVQNSCVASDVLFLERIPAPLSYYCDTISAPEAVMKSTYGYSADDCNSA